jgi:hypothetical protein
MVSAGCRWGMKSLLLLLALGFLNLLANGSPGQASAPDAASRTRTAGQQAASAPRAATAARAARPPAQQPTGHRVTCCPVAPDGRLAPCDTSDSMPFSIQLGDKGDRSRLPVIVRLISASVPCRFRATFTARINGRELGKPPPNAAAGLTIAGAVDVAVTEAYAPVVTIEWRNDCQIHGMFMVTILLSTDGGPRTVAGGNNANPTCIDPRRVATLRQAG